MAYGQVFGYLKDIFPQVDPRLLKAVAIEHNNDVNMAVDFILSKVAPSTISFTKVSYIRGDDSSIHDPTNSGGESSSGLKSLQLPFGTTVRGDDAQHGSSQTSPTLESRKIHMDPAVNVNDVSLEHSTMQYELLEGMDIVNGLKNYSNASVTQKTQCPSEQPEKEDVHHTDAIDTIMTSISSSVEVLEPKVHEVIELLIFETSDKTADACSRNKVQLSESSDEKNDFKGIFETGLISADVSIPSTALAVQSGYSETVPTERSSGHITLQKSSGMTTTIDDAQLGSSQTSTKLVNREIYTGPDFNIDGVSVECSTKKLELQDDMNIINEGLNNYLNDSLAQETQCSDDSPRKEDLLDMEAIDTITDPVSSSAEVFKSNTFEDSELLTFNISKKLPYSTSEEEEQFLKDFDKKNDGFLTSGSGVMSADIDIASASMGTHSGHSICSELLEDLITDAKDNKKNLLSTMESVRDMITKVVLLEETAKKVKGEASNAGEDILSKAEELRQTLKHAKDENDRHAGEVYGEKSILATEARELQSRLLSLSDQKNKSLSIVDEIRETLEFRLVTAGEEIAAAEQVKQERVTLAQKSLKEQELVMESIVEESNRLHEEAEENAKLREFLIDRGQVVDALQGEMAVIFEDVMTLKNRVEGHLPLNRSMRFEVSSLVSSLSSSYSRSEHSSGANVTLVDSDINTSVVDRKHHEMQQLECETSNNCNAPRSDVGVIELNKNILLQRKKGKGERKIKGKKIKMGRMGRHLGRRAAPNGNSLRTCS